MLVAVSAHAQNEKWRRDAPCGERQAAMQPASTQGCYRAWCSRYGARKALRVRKGKHRGHAIILERATRGKETWTARFIPPLGGDVTHFRIDRIGDRNLLFAVMRSESVGIAVSDWERVGDRWR
jgi:hypothetical protein